MRPLLVVKLDVLNAARYSVYDLWRTVNLTQDLGLRDRGNDAGWTISSRQYAGGAPEQFRGSRHLSKAGRKADIGTG